MRTVSDFPTSSTQNIDVNVYDIRQLATLMDLKDRDNAEEIPKTTRPDTHIHFHTLTLETTLVPPDEFHHVYHRGDYQERPNPAFAPFDLLRTTLRNNSEPFQPVLLLPPTFGILHTPPNVLDQTPAYLAKRLGTAQVNLPSTSRHRPLVELPRFMTQGNKDWLISSKTWDLQNWLQSILALDPDELPTRKGNYKGLEKKRRFFPETSIQICWIPDGDVDDENSGTEIKLLITIDVFVDFPILLEKLPDVGDDMQGLVLHSFIPSSSLSHPTSESEARSSALRHFFECLKPAPDLPLTFSAKNLQPKGMVTKLLPFQMRTLVLLLKREWAPLMMNDRKRKLFDERLGRDPDGFWEVIDFGGNVGRVGYRRVTGDLVKLGPSRIKGPDRKGKGKEVDDGEEGLDGISENERAKLPVLVDLSNVRGTMLCEEMGLGKTVEAIALVLLHRHPLSSPREFEHSTHRSGRAEGSRKKGPVVVPTVDLALGVPGLEDQKLCQWIQGEKKAFEGTAVWNAEAELNIGEVATTLIVTPPSLLKQWISEMQTHVPSIRVCVYEGWKSLQAGVRRQKAASIKAHENKRKRLNERLREEVVRKYTRGSRGRVKVKVEDDEEGEAGADMDVDEQEVQELREDEEDMEKSLLEITQRQFVEYVRAHDVVVTTYQDLQQDLTVALPPPKRSRRSIANYRLNERPRSPLVMVQWWRVIMDEVQLCGDQSQAAEMVSLIPRQLSLAVSGTPARSDIKDLMGSLRFLRVPTIPYDNRLWYRLQQSSMRPAFEGIFKELAVRTTKKEVSGEFDLPSQTRFVVPIELSEIELHYYNDTLERQRHLLRLDARAYGQEWVLDRGLFRSALLNLRQICTHIQVGAGQERAVRGERLHLGRALMTMSEALDKIRTEHSVTFMLESRIQMRAMIKKAKLLVLDDKDDLRYMKAIDLYKKVRDNVVKQLSSVRDQLQKLLGDRDADSVDEEDETPDRNMSQADKERANAITHARQQIREMSIILHQAWFFEGDIRHILKEEDAEVACYEKADEVRKEILARPLQIATNSIDQLKRSLGRSEAVNMVEDLQTTETKYRGGFHSRETILKVNSLLKILNDNALLVFDWREKIIKLLSSPVEAEGDIPLPGQGQEIEDPDAEYYAEALKAQGEVEAYMIAYAAAVADRKEFMLEERSLLAAHDAKTAKLRKTRRAQEARLDAPVEVADDVEEQVTVLMAERQALRSARVDHKCQRPLKALLMDLNAVVHGQDRLEEISIAKTVATMVKKYIAEQAEYVEKLNKELEVFRATFNRRVVYFASLQEISDSVSPIEVKNLKDEIQDASEQIDRIELNLSRMIVKGRYLQYLGAQQEGKNVDIREDCIICFGTSEDSQAAILGCGHAFCISCYRGYRQSMHGRTCPVCKTPINDKEITRIKLHETAANLKERQPTNGGSSNQPISPLKGFSSGEIEELDPEIAERERRVLEMQRLRMMPVDRMREVAQMDMMGEFGSKINFLVKHLLYYRFKEPEARHVIFSNWSDSLNIVILALTLNGIKFSSFGAGKDKDRDVVERFQKDKTIAAFLLHAEKESSGLTLTSCSVVHLLEPVLKHSFELQAIGRVDRLGQTKPTTVYCYATMETVESRILAQGVRNSTSIYLEDENSDNLVASMPNFASAAHKGGDLNDNDDEELIKLII